MENYHFWQDFFDTYQSLSDWIKALWYIVPFVFVLAVTALVLRYRLGIKKIAAQQNAALKYTLIADGTRNNQLYAHNDVGALAEFVPVPNNVIPLDLPPPKPNECPPPDV